MNKNHEETLQLHKEELEISKKRVETANVTVYKKTYTEERQITVPVTHEELVIEKRKINNQGSVIEEVETNRIPLSEDRIEITLHPTILENVEIYKKQFQEIEQVVETVKQEKVYIKTVGDVKFTVDNQSTSLLHNEEN